jgi:hypothetical protein
MLRAMEVNVAELKHAVEVQHGCTATVFPTSADQRDVQR